MKAARARGRRNTNTDERRGGVRNLMVLGQDGGEKKKKLIGGVRNSAQRGVGV